MNTNIKALVASISHLIISKASDKFSDRMEVLEYLKENYLASGFTTKDDSDMLSADFLTEWFTEHELALHNIFTTGSVKPNETEDDIVLMGDAEYMTSVEDGHPFVYMYDKASIHLGLYASGFLTLMAHGNNKIHIESGHNAGVDVYACNGASKIDVHADNSSNISLKIGDGTDAEVSLSDFATANIECLGRSTASVALSDLSRSIITLRDQSKVDCTKDEQAMCLVKKIENYAGSYCCEVATK